eukprot:Gb_02638 [translate_table: standard]
MGRLKVFDVKYSSQNSEIIGSPSSYAFHGFDSDHGGTWWNSDQSNKKDDFDKVFDNFQTIFIISLLIALLGALFKAVERFYYFRMVNRHSSGGSSLPIWSVSEIQTNSTDNDSQTSYPSSPSDLETAHVEGERPRSERQFSFDQVVEITENFRKKLGQGGFGPVYYGKLNSGSEVAVKRLSSNSNQGVKEFLNEVELLTRVHHRNLVTLVGSCQDRSERFLIYEYMPKGTLDDHLHGSTSVREPLSWTQRLRIAVDAARGFEYLHTGCWPAIIHRDVKSSNILLDENLCGKVSDFGLSKLVSDGNLTHVSTAVKGTIGYLDPDYAILERLTEKSDVYGFGVVLLEIVCGRKPIMEMSANPSPDMVHIVDWARSSVQAGSIEDIADSSMANSYNTTALAKVVEIAFKCVQQHHGDRPTMSEVLQNLKEALDMEHKTSNMQPFETEQDQQIEAESLPLLRPPKLHSEKPFLSLPITRTCL